MNYQIRESARGCTERVKGKPGTFRIYFSLGRDEATNKYLRTPKRIIHCRSKNPNNWRGECERALAKYREELTGGTAGPNGRVTVSQYATSFHEMRRDELGSPLSYQREGDYVRHICDMFGETRLTSLRPDDIRRAYALARTGGMSESELHGTHIKLSQIMQDALENELIERNPCSSVKAPTPSYRVRKPLTAEEASRLMSCLEAEGYSPATVGTMLLLLTGMRKGEMLALTWADFDREALTLRIDKQYTNDHELRPPKSRMSRRTIAVGEALARYLDGWRDEQRAELSGLGLRQGEDTPIVHAVGASPKGGETPFYVKMMDGHNYGRWFRNFCVDNGFGEYGHVTNTFLRNGRVCRRGDHYAGLVPHALRHTQATLLIGEGADVKTVQARLGHASPSTTLSIYSHAIESKDRNAAETIDRILGDETDKP